MGGSQATAMAQPVALSGAQRMMIQREPATQTPVPSPAMKPTPNAMPQEQSLSAEDVTKLIQQAKSSTTDPVSTAMGIFKELGNVSVPGDVLRKAVKESGITLAG